MGSLTDDEIRDLCQLLGNRSTDEDPGPWMKLRELGPAVVPYLVEAYPTLKQWKGRVACVFHLISYARTHEEAYRLGITALEDRATLVRYRACMLLAEAQRAEAVPHLRKLLDHPDKRTAEDAAAAIDAIENRNPNYFIDRTHSGRMFSSVGGEPGEFLSQLSQAKRPWWKFW